MVRHKQYILLWHIGVTEPPSATSKHNTPSGSKGKPDMPSPTTYVSASYKMKKCSCKSPGLHTYIGAWKDVMHTCHECFRWYYTVIHFCIYVLLKNWSPNLIQPKCRRNNISLHHVVHTYTYTYVRTYILHICFNLLSSYGACPQWRGSGQGEDNCTNISTWGKSWKPWISSNAGRDMYVLGHLLATVKMPSVRVHS